ncbi:MAG: RNA polymerase sigma factor [Planctomycetota bacterium]
MPSRSLVLKAQKGNRKAFSQLVEAHRRLAWGIAYGIIGDVHLAADAVQEAFFKAYKGVRQLKDPDRFLAWIITIVRSSATDLVRRRARWGSREGSALPEAAGKAVRGEVLGAPEEILLREEEASRIRKALAALSSEYREVLLLKHFEGKSYQEMARLLKTSVRAVESKLFRARQQLSRHLDPSGEQGGYQGKGQRTRRCEKQAVPGAPLKEAQKSPRGQHGSAADVAVGAKWNRDPQERRGR